VSGAGRSGGRPGRISPNRYSSIRLRVSCRSSRECRWRQDVPDFSGLVRRVASALRWLSFSQLFCRIRATHGAPDATFADSCPIANGGLWIGSSSDASFRFDETTETFSHVAPRSRGPQRSAQCVGDALAATADGRLWVAATAVSDDFDPRAGAFEPVTLAVRGEQPVVLSLLIDRAGTLWAGTQSGLYIEPRVRRNFGEFALGRGGTAEADGLQPLRGSRRPLVGRLGKYAVRARSGAPPCARAAVVGR